MMAMRDDGAIHGHRLFERLTQPSTAMLPSGHLPALAETVESIKRHLVDLLNSHPGHSECVPELGLLDFNDATIGVLDLELNIQQAIRTCIERYEPRVRRVTVESLPNGDDPLQLRFQVHCTLAGNHDQAETVIDLLLNDKRYQCLS